jgi:hypothetical protein
VNERALEVLSNCDVRAVTKLPTKTRAATSQMGRSMRFVLLSGDIDPIAVFYGISLSLGM